jgi:hypothetical protein
VSGLSVEGSERALLASEAQIGGQLGVAVVGGPIFGQCLDLGVDARSGSASSSFLSASTSPWVSVC